MLVCAVTVMVPTWINWSPQFRNFNFFVDFCVKSALLKRRSSSDRKTNRAVRRNARENPGALALKPRPRVARPRSARAPWPLLVCEPGARGATYHVSNLRDFGTSSGILLVNAVATHPTTATNDLRTSASSVTSSLHQIRKVEAEFVF